MNFVLGANCQLLFRHNPELVVPCRSITFSVSSSTMYNEHVVTWFVSILFYGCRERIPAAIAIKILALHFTPGTYINGIFGIFEINLVSSEFCPSFFGITVDNSFNPLFGSTTFFLPNFNSKRLPFDNCSSSSWLSNKVT